MAMQARAVVKLILVDPILKFGHIELKSFIFNFYQLQ